MYRDRATLAEGKVTTGPEAGDWTTGLTLFDFVPDCNQGLRIYEVGEDAKYRFRRACNELAFGPHQFQLSIPTGNHTHFGTSFRVFQGKHATDATRSPENQDSLPTGRNNLSSR